MEVHMLGWAVTFFIVALIAGVLGFTGIAIAAAGIANANGKSRRIVGYGGICGC